MIEEKLNRRIKTWMKQNIKWLSRWGINLHEFPNGNVEIKKYVREKVKVALWSKQFGRKREYYIKNFNPTCEHQQKHYIEVDIKWKEKMLIAQLRTSSHYLRCVTGRWKIPKEEWAGRVCLLCMSGSVEME